MKKSKTKMKTIKSVSGKKFRVPVAQRKSLKDMIYYEISETYEQDKETQNIIYAKIRKLEEKLYETITIKEKALVDDIVELMGEADYHFHQYFYDAVWEVIKEWTK